jgi:hypothetical protein
MSAMRLTNNVLAGKNFAAQTPSKQKSWRNQVANDQHIFNLTY